MPAVFFGTEVEVREEDGDSCGCEGDNEGGEGEEAEGVVGARGEEAREDEVELNEGGAEGKDACKNCSPLGDPRQLCSH